MPEITIKDIKEIVQKDIKELLQKDIKEIVRSELKIQFKKELKPIKDKLDDMTIKLDNTSALVVNLSEDLKDVPKNIEAILERQRHTETNIDWLATKK
jgi:hypothetical protein